LRHPLTGSIIRRRPFRWWPRPGASPCCRCMRRISYHGPWSAGQSKESRRPLD
jgi:hypothetical protein